MPKKKNKVNWKIFSKIAIKLIKFASEATCDPVNAGRWEEIIFYTLKGMNKKFNGEDPYWISGSHRKGADLWTDDVIISAKGGKIENGVLSLSSYRLTSFKTLKKMKEFVDGEGKNFDVYLCCSRKDSKDGNRVYRLFVASSDIFLAKKLQWHAVSGGWIGKDRKGIEVHIVKKMSNQLWMKIPIRLCLEIGTISFTKKELGSKLNKLAKKSV